MDSGGCEPCANDFAAYEHRDEVSYGPTLLTRTGYWLGDCYASGGWTETWPAPGMPGVGDYWTDGWPPMSDQPIPPFYPEMPFHIGCMVTNWNGGESGYYTDEICESVTVRYVTGHGTPSKPRLHRLCYDAIDRETWNPVPYGSITALGRALDTNGC